MRHLLPLSILLLTISCTPKLQNNTHRLTSSGDILKIEYKGEADSVRFEMYQGLGVDLTKNQSDLFDGELEIPDLEDGIFSYGFFIKKDSAGYMLPVEYKPKEEKEYHFKWVGANRKNNYLKSKKLVGTITEQIFKGESFERKITIYNPPTSNPTTPIIYFTDANWFLNGYIDYIDKLIADEKIKPIKFIGLHNNQDNRFEEYVFNPENDSLFRAHEHWLFNELMPSVEQEIASWKGKRYIYGVSNSGAFCMYVGLNYPRLFEEIISFSTVAYINEFPHPVAFNFDKYPKFYMGAGRYEDWAFEDNIKFVEKMKTQNIEVEFKEYIASHDYFVWRIEFLDYLVKRFGKI